jgi:ribosomal-protein-alanine N-acetyltransferase
MKSEIRCMRSEDIDRVYEIECSVHLAPWGKDVLSDCVLVGYDCRVLELHDEQPLIVGYIISRYFDTTCHILNLCVAKSHQAQGLGRLLLESFMQSLSSPVSLMLEVRPSNAVAIHLYQTLGFKPIEIKKDYYNDEHGVEDAIVLQKKAL